MLILISALTFGTVVLLFLGLTMKTEREIIQDRIRQHQEMDASILSSIEAELERPIKQRIIAPILLKLANLVSSFTPAGALRAIDDKLETAGRPWSLSAKEFVGLRVLSTGASIVFGSLLSNFIDAQPPIRILAFVLIVFIGIILPDYLLQRAINNRQTQIRKVLADTLDLLTVSVEAGLGLDGAMQKVTEKLHNPLSDEMTRALQEIRIGKMRMEALRDMARRVKVTELSSFVTAVCQADQLGVSIAKVLRVQGETLRTQRSQKAREAAAKLPVKMLFPLVFFIFPALFVVIAGPAFIQIFRQLGSVIGSR
ncbi:MAG: type II secretion system F family protein [Armatimonadetes bacterium]|nr:type II secretion system F family protein [Armatimonadota bacterium]